MINHVMYLILQPKISKKGTGGEEAILTEDYASQWTADKFATASGKFVQVKTDDPNLMPGKTAVIDLLATDNLSKYTVLVSLFYMENWKTENIIKV